MLIVLPVVFWICFFIFAYSYFIYPVLLTTVSRLFGTDIVRDESYTPTVAVAVPAYNEQDVILAKIKNILALDYPADKIQVWVGSDCSTDDTEKIVKEFAQNDPRVHLWLAPTREGKTQIMNRMIPLIDSEIILLTDANTMHRSGSLRTMVRNFADPKVGAVAGHIEHYGKSKVGAEERLYRNFEVRQKHLEARLHSTISAFGGFYSLRRKLFKPIPPNAYSNDDVLYPMNVIRQGYRVAYEMESISQEDMTEDIQAEFKRRIRIGAGNFQAFFWLLDFLNPLRGWPWFCYVSHKASRWFSPLALALCFIACGILAFLGADSIYDIFFWAGVGIIAFGLTFITFPTRFTRHVFYFLSMNTALILGLFRYLGGIKNAAWNPTARN